MSITGTHTIMNRVSYFKINYVLSLYGLLNYTGRSFDIMNINIKSLTLYQKDWGFKLGFEKFCSGIIQLYLKYLFASNLFSKSYL